MLDVLNKRRPMKKRSPTAGGMSTYFKTLQRSYRALDGILKLLLMK